MIYFLGTNTSLQHRFHIVFTFVGVHSSRTIDQINTLGQSHILPHLCLSRYWSSLTYLLFLQRINHTALTHVRIPHETHTNVLLVSVENVELSQQIYQRSLAERISDTTSVSDSGVLLT